MIRASRGDLIFGVLAAIFLSPGLAAIVGAVSESTVQMLTFGFFGLGLLLGAFAPTIRRAFGRSFLLCGVSLIALLLTTGLLSGSAANDAINNSSTDGLEQSGAIIGAGLGAAAITGFATFIGLILGAIFLIIGLVLTLGGRQEVIVVEDKRRIEPKL